MKYIRKSLVLFLSCTTSFTSTAAFVVNTCSYRCCQVSRSMSSSAGEDERERLLEKASRLRQEANEIANQLRSSPVSKRGVEATTIPSPVCLNIEDSIWTFSYRFSDEPEVSDGAEQASTKRNFYAGKLTLKLKSDGYTEILNHEQGAGALQIFKAWGWDVEHSSDDDLNYLMFSVDANVPSKGKQRFYFQARKEKSNLKGIALNEGTVTIKQDIVESLPTRGFFGLFSPKGILAQFRLVGNFVAKTVQIV